MIDVVIKLTWSYTVFRELFGKKGDDREATYQHPELFLTMHDALLCNFCVGTALLFNEKEKATSICNLIRDAGKTKPALAIKLERKLRDNQGPLKKIVALRHQVFAHRWMSKTAEKAVGEVKPCLSVMKEVVELARFLICELAGEAGGGRKERLESQQLSKRTLKCIADDARQVVGAFVCTIR